MKRSLFFSLVVLLWGVSGFAQEAKASMSPAEVTAGKNITITITVNKTTTIQGSYINVTFAPRDSKEESQSFSINLGRRDEAPLTYDTSVQIPPNAKGVWYVKEAFFHLPVAGGGPLQIDHPEFTVKPVEIPIPTSGKVVVSSK